MGLAPSSLEDCLGRAAYARRQAALSDPDEANAWLNIAAEWDEVASALRKAEDVELTNKGLTARVAFCT